MTLAAMEKDQRSPEYPVLMCLDEFATLGHMQSLENASGQIAGLGCKLWPIVQDIGQMEQLYGKRWETFVGNSGILQFFGNSDAKTLQWISQRLGSTTIQTRSQSNQTYKAKAVQGASGLSFGQQVHPLMTPEEVSRFFARDNSHLRQLIFYPGKDAMVLQRAYNDSHPYFKAYQDFMGIGGNNE
jgi:type IV secretion system protein VirD4